MTRHTKPISAEKQGNPEPAKPHQQVVAGNMEKLESFKALEQNWNENEAARFEPAFIEHVKKIVSLLPIQPQIFPTGRNTIQLEYDKQNGDSIELEIYPDGLIESVQFLKTGTIEQDITEALLHTHIEIFYAD